MNTVKFSTQMMEMIHCIIILPGSFTSGILLFLVGHITCEAYNPIKSIRLPS